VTGPLVAWFVAASLATAVNVYAVEPGTLVLGVNMPLQLFAVVVDLAAMTVPVLGTLFTV